MDRWPVSDEDWQAWRCGMTLLEYRASQHGIPPEEVAAMREAMTTTVTALVLRTPVLLEYVTRLALQQISVNGPPVERKP